MIHEANLDGLVGPTHNYAGLSPGNLASINNKGSISSPRKAALQGLQKMKLLSDLGIRQLIMPPAPRPLPEVLKEANDDRPELLAAAYSSSFMWTANAATITPAIDSKSKRTHITPANLISNYHRSIEAKTTAQNLKYIFNNEKLFTHHDPLPAEHVLSDEGAANHTRLCPSHSDKGLHLFAYSMRGRQSYKASEAIARMHNIPDKNLMYAEQHPEAIDKGVFHNDVISTGNENLFLYHELTFRDNDEVINDLQERYQKLHEQKLTSVEIKQSDLSLEEAVSSYLFNSQILTLSDKSMLLLAPMECKESDKASKIINNIIGDNNPLKAVEYLDLRESMQNGGGPACLRLRIPLSDDELESIPESIFFNNKIYEELCNSITENYRESLKPEDLMDPALQEESLKATREIYEILNFPIPKI